MRQLIELFVQYEQIIDCPVHGNFETVIMSSSANKEGEEDRFASNEEPPPKKRKVEVASEAEFTQEVRNVVREAIGPIAKPDVVHIVPGLPKTRSGKIMRRILRKVASGDTDRLGDTSTLLNPVAIVLLLVLLFQIIFKKTASGLIIGSIFLLLNLYMVLALISELSEFDVVNQGFINLLTFGSIFLGLNIIVSFLMLFKYLKSINAKMDKSYN